MKSKIPYLIKSFYDWIVESNCTPYILVDTTIKGVCLPDDFFVQSEVVLNVSPLAIREFEIDDTSISFLAQFNVITFSVFIPLVAVYAIYPQEYEREGLFFNKMSTPDSREYYILADNFSNSPSEQKVPAEKKPTKLKSIQKTKEAKNSKKKETRKKPNLKIIK